MIPYFILFGATLFGVLSFKPVVAGGRNNVLPWIVFGVLLWLMIGFRWRVGGDWGFEAKLVARYGYYSLADLVQILDPVFALMVWMFADSSYNVWTFNLVTGAVFSFGLVAFCRTQPFPWLAALVAVPYLIVVVAMGYSRQSMAIGFFLLALVALENRSLMKYLIFMALAAATHSTAVLLVPVAFLASRQHRLQTLAIGIPVALGLFAFLLQDRVDRYVGGYITTEFQSEGTLVRLLMNALPGSLFLLRRNNFNMSSDGVRLWTIMSAIAILLLPIYYFSPSSTAVDRMALYFIPVQLVVWSRLPFAWHQSVRFGDMIWMVVLYSAAVLFVWLNFASHAQYWLPYDIYPYESLWGISQS
jgi:hypothetical protein